MKRGECLSDLARDPFRGRMKCGVDPGKISAGQSNDDEDIVESLETRTRSDLTARSAKAPIEQTPPARSTTNKRAQVDR